MSSAEQQMAEDAKRFSIDIRQLQELGEAAIKAKDRAYCKAAFNVLFNIVSDFLVDDFVM